MVTITEESQTRWADLKNQFYSFELGQFSGRDSAGGLGSTPYAADFVNRGADPLGLYGVFFDGATP